MDERHEISIELEASLTAFYYNYAVYYRMLFTLIYCLTKIPLYKLSAKFYSITDQFGLIKYATDIVQTSVDYDYAHTEWIPLEWRCRIQARLHHDFLNFRFGTGNVRDNLNKESREPIFGIETLYSPLRLKMGITAMNMVSYSLDSISLSKDLFWFLKTVNPKWALRGVDLYNDFEFLQKIDKSIDEETFSQAQIF